MKCQSCDREAEYGLTCCGWCEKYGEAEAGWI